jgi:hypothetical protein
MKLTLEKQPARSHLVLTICISLVVTLFFAFRAEVTGKDIVQDSPSTSQMAR